MDLRAIIESYYGHQVSQLRMQYTQEDKEVIEEFLKAKRSFSLKSDTHVERESLFGNSERSLTLYLFITSYFSLAFLNIIHAERPLLTFTKHLSHEQLFLWLCSHPGLMGVDRYDIGKLKGIYMYALATYRILRPWLKCRHRHSNIRIKELANKPARKL